MSKGLEALKDLYNGNLTKEYKLQCYKDIKKSLKALEIIHKNIGLKRLMNEFDYLVNMEEYDLLKEVLL